MTSPTRVTLEDIEANIKSEHYFRTSIAWEAMGGQPVAELEPLTICVLVLQNGFTVIGQSACVDPANFNAEIGRTVARQNAVNHIWPLMGYALKTELSKVNA